MMVAEDVRQVVGLVGERPEHRLPGLTHEAQ